MSKWLLALCLTLMLAKATTAHDWYPPECCSGQDCAPVIKAEMVEVQKEVGGLVPPAHASTQVLVVTTKHGTVMVPPGFPRRESKDGGMHACMMPGANGTMQLICIFMPPSS